MPFKQEELRYAHSEGHTDVCYFEDGETFVTCGADGDIRIWSVDESKDPIHNCVGEWALAVRQKENSLYVATGSNDIQLLTLPDGERNGVLDRFVAPINHIALSKKEKMIVLAGEDMEVKVRNLRDNKVKILDGPSGPCLSVAICPNLEYVAASSGDTKLRIWNLINNKLLHEISCFPKVNSFANAKVLCRLDFEPVDGKQLAYPYENTVIILDIVSGTQDRVLVCDNVSSHFSIVQYSPCGKYIVATSLEGDIIIWNVASKIVVNYGKHERNIRICGLMWNPKDNGEILFTDVEGQLGMISNAVETKSDFPLEEDNAFETEENFEDIQFQDEDDDNENAISVEKLKRDIMGSPESDSKPVSAASSRSSTPRPSSPLIPLQSPFMPSCTPEHLDPRYLCWNEVGVIRSFGHNSGDENCTKSIEVEFHDSTFHSSMMIQNYQEYTMGSLSKTVLVIANTSQLNAIPLSGGSKDWILNMEDEEEIVLIAASENLICFAMSNYIIRFCSVYGNQVAVVSIPGPVVSISAYKSLVMVAYHLTAVRNHDQCINIRLMNVQGMSVHNKNIGSALGPKSTLRWLGFSDVGTPSMMDSLGMLSLYPLSCETWIPYCDMSKQLKSPADSFFVTTVFESYQAVGGIKCKGTVYPSFTPRPTMCEVLLEPPFAERGTEKTEMERNLFIWSTLQIRDVDRKFKETALKTFALACRNNLDERAFELMEILANPQILSLSLKYVTKLNRRRLAEKLMILARNLTEEHEEINETELKRSDPTIIRPPQKKLSTNSSKNIPNIQMNEEKEDILKLSDNNENESFNETSSISQPLLTPGEKKNPFLKSLKKSKVESNINPLSLTDKFAGIEYEQVIKTKAQNKQEVGEKRKLLDSDGMKQKEKQRKLDSFRFSKKPIQ